MASEGNPSSTRAKKTAPQKATSSESAPQKSASGKSAVAKASSDKAASRKAPSAARAAAPSAKRAKVETPLSPVAEALLDAQLAFWMKHLGPKAWPVMVKDEWPAIWAAMDTIALADAFDEAKVKDIAHVYALEMEVSGAILELAGEIATLVFTSPRNRKTRLKDVLSDRTFDDILEKTFETGGVVDRITGRMRESEAFRESVSELVLGILKGSLSDETGRGGMGRVGRGARVLRNWIGERAPELSETLSESARRWFDGGVNSAVDLVLAMLEHDRYRDTAIVGVSRWWDRVKERPVSDVQKYLSNLDLQEYIVLGYEFWLEFRKSDYLKSLIDGGIGLFYRKYGEESLQQVVLEMGLDENMLEQSFRQYGGEIVAALVKTGIAEGFIRHRLRLFYTSEEARRILG